MKFYHTSMGQLRLCGLAEGVSLILLMGLAMPLKYLAGIPEAVKWTGWVHGILFIGFSGLILRSLITGEISFRTAVLAFVAALLPFGPFLMDHRLASADRTSNP